MFQQQGKYPEALKMYEKVLKTRVAVLGPEHLDTANTYNNIGEVYRQQAKYPEAMEMYEKSLEIKLKVVGRDHLEVAIAQNKCACMHIHLYMCTHVYICSIAIAYKDQGKYPEALELYHQSLATNVLSLR